MAHLKSELQGQYDKIFPKPLVQITVLKRGHLEQIRVMEMGSYDHTKHVIIGRFSSETFNHVILKDVTGRNVYRMMIFYYFKAHYAATGAGASSPQDAEQLIIQSFDQIFTKFRREYAYLRPIICNYLLSQ